MLKKPGQSDNKTTRHFNRRDFLKRIGTAAAAISAPSIVPASVFGKNAPSNRITIASIGVGGQGTHNLNAFLRKSDAQVLAVCDVEKGSNEYGAYLWGQWFGAEPARRLVDKYYAGQSDSGSYKGTDACSDFRRIIERDDIDAVVVCTPDHWHIPISVAAAKAGKDIYCEKPLSLTIAQGRQLVDAVEKYGRVFQTGSHRRSADSIRKACELARNGYIGKLEHIRTYIPGNNCQCEPTWSPQRVPESLDYDFWLGPAPKQPYHQQRCHYQFRFIADYSGGQITNFGAHFLDMAQWGLGTDLSGPTEIQGQGRFPETGLFNTALEYHISYKYPNGTVIHCDTGPGPHVRFEGTEGWIEINGFNISASDPAIIKEKIKPSETHLYRSTDHHQNFLDCVKSRRKPITHTEIGHRSATMCHLGNIAAITGRKLTWDPAAEQFANDPVANQMCTQPLRSPWRI